ncbi:dephospho-CoA kinase [Kangiella sp. HD9-110m-PIT-SAG07]|nr:dephospho-CoA kinase [Kangiella sp. HD9-110m-PIT-SAG07]
MTYHIVLTGGVASGKSAVSQLFDELGVTVIDADLVARDVVALDSAGLQQITDYFGGSVLNKDGTLNRQTLREIIFNSNEKREWLNQLLHPMIRQEMERLRQKAEECDELYTINVIPLYLETIHGTSEAMNYQRVLVVDVSESVQLERLLQRDSGSLKQAKALMKTQANRKERLSIADDIIDNGSDLQSLKQRVINLDKHYRELARG